MMDKSRYACFGYDQRVEVFGPKGMILADNQTPYNVVRYQEAGNTAYVHNIYIYIYIYIYI